MIRTLKIENLKGFEEYEINFDRLNLLVGGNNSGKTTIFHALQLFFWCVDQTSDSDRPNVVSFKKTQVPELGGLPYFSTRDLFYRQQMRSGRSPKRIKLTLTADDMGSLCFDIYPAFSRNVMIDGRNQEISKQQFETLKLLKPVFVPGTIGITVREEMYREVAQERMILEGRQNQVLRNLVYRLRNADSWQSFVDMVSPLFRLQGLDVPFNTDSDEWLTAVYTENGCTFDLISAGSGFLQVINLLSFLFLHRSRVALLDEPDSHMHDDLQKLTFDQLDRLSNDRSIQLIIATHSPTFIDAAGLDNVLLIDRSSRTPLRAQDVDTLVPLLGDRGISLPPAKVMNTLKSRRVLFVEGYEADYEEFIQRFGEILNPGFRASTRGLTVFETSGSTQKWPFDAVDHFARLVGVPLQYVFLSDRDFLTDDQIAERESRARAEERSIAHLTRRNRESYLLDPRMIATVIARKWPVRHPHEEYPGHVSETALLDFILQRATELTDETQAKFLTAQETNLRLPGSQRQQATTELARYFRINYTQEIAEKRIPYKLLDAKEVLKNLRTHVTETIRISFTDREIIESFASEEIATDLQAHLRSILHLFE